MEELLDALEDCDESEISTLEESVEPEGVMALGDSPVKAQEKRKTMRLSGFMNPTALLVSS